MNVLITYDVNTEDKAGQRRLAKVARLCKDYGQRVQNSVFECMLSEVQLLELTNKLEKTMDTQSDSIRVYYLNRSENRRVIVLGKNDTVNVDGMLII